jgi:MinD superfamily P-loop ATPase
VVKEIAVISGKGGTGKTSISGAFSALSKDIVLADCDVDAPDLHIILQPEVQRSIDFIGGLLSHIDGKRCTECGICTEYCRFNAIRPPKVDSLSCEGCAVCAKVCPENAIEMRKKVSGKLFSSMTRFGPMSHAKLLPGEGNSGKLVTEVRKQAREMAEQQGADLILVDGSPGIGCPVIATVTGIDYAVIVTEPTLSGIHDMKRVIDLLQRFRVQPLTIINKADLNPKNTASILEFCKENDVTVLGQIPFDPVVTEAMVATKTIPEYSQNHFVSKVISDIWSMITDML